MYQTSTERGVVVRNVLNNHAETKQREEQWKLLRVVPLQQRAECSAWNQANAPIREPHSASSRVRCRHCKHG